MTRDRASEAPPAQSLPVLTAESVSAVDGANLGDPFSICEDLILGDTYRLHPGSQAVRLAVAQSPDGDGMMVARGTEAGLVGSELHLDSSVTVMSTDGTLVEILVIVELNRDLSTIAQVYLFALAPLDPRREYTLVAVDRDAAPTRFAEIACVSFTRGTRITTANGRPVPIEDLRVGDRVLTRDHGAQEIRWIGQRTVRATGAFAPIRIHKGVLNNEDDLVVSPNHRLFVYQRQDALGTGRSEVLVRAKSLLNGTTVTRTDGGFVDYFQILFDRHEIIYAQGIAAETLLVDTRTRPAVPAGIRDGGRAYGPEMEPQARARFSVDLLRRSSAS